MTVIPEPANEDVAPLTNPVPVIVTFWAVAPCPSADGEVEVTVGAELTVKTAEPVALEPSPLVTVTLREPVVAEPEIVTLAVSEVALT